MPDAQFDVIRRGFEDFAKEFPEIHLRVCLASPGFDLKSLPERDVFPPKVEERFLQGWPPWEEYRPVRTTDDGHQVADDKADRPVPVRAYRAFCVLYSPDVDPDRRKEETRVLERLMHLARDAARLFQSQKRLMDLAPTDAGRFPVTPNAKKSELLWFLWLAIRHSQDWWTLRKPGSDPEAWFPPTIGDRFYREDTTWDSPGFRATDIPDVALRSADALEAYLKPPMASAAFQTGKLAADESEPTSNLQSAPPPTQSAPIESTEGPGPKSSSGFLGSATLAEALGIHPSRTKAFFRQLERRRTSLGDDCWSEVNNPKPNCPRFFYRVDSPALRALAAPYTKPRMA